MSSGINFISFNGFKRTNDAEGLCSNCHTKIKKSSNAFQDESMGVIFHEKCAKNTQAYKEWRELDHVTPFREPEVYCTLPSSLNAQPHQQTSQTRTNHSQSSETPEFSDQIEGRPSGFWARNRFKIIVGTAAAIAITGIAIAALNTKAEDWHRFCLQSAENAKDLFCCAKQVTADATTCLFKRFEPVNFWTFAGDPEQLSLAELPTTKPEPVILSSWPVTIAQKLFQRFFG